MSEKPKLISLTIDGVPIDVMPGTTILEAALELNIDIPYLCHEERLRPFGACRVCLVEVKGGRGPIPACTTPVGPDMEVTTNSEMINQLRKNVLELLLIHHPLDCPVCDKAGECTLQDLVYKYGPTSNRYMYGQDRNHEAIDHRSPFIERNNNRCVLCGACARICNEVQSVSEISFVSRGFNATVGTIFDQPLSCEFCGQCISACPVGALNNSLFSNTSRVWDLKKTKTTCGICGNGCAFTIETRDNEVYRINHEVSRGTNKGILCGKGRFAYEHLSRKDRLTTPLIKKDGEFVEATWDEALDFVAAGIINTIKADGPGAVGALGSPHGTNEDAKALKHLFGDLLRVKNIDSQARFFLAPTLEITGPETGTIEDVDQADLFLIIDSATTNSQPVLGNRLIRRQRFAEIPMIVVDPRRTKQGRFADVWFESKPGTSAGVVAALGKAAGKLSGTEYKEATAKAAGVSDDAMAKAAELLKNAEKPVIVLGTWPYMEELNASNARMAYALAKATGAKIVVPAEKANLRGLLKYGVAPVGDGLDATEMTEQAGQGGIKAMYVCGENPVANFPSGKEVAANLAKLELLVVSDLFMTETAKLAHVVLPACAAAEKSGTLTNFEGTELAIEKALTAPGLARPDVNILIDLAGRLRHEITIADVNNVQPVNGWAEPKHPELSFKQAAPPADRPFSFVTGPILFQCGTLTTYSSSLSEVCGKTVVRVNPEDAKAAGLQTGDQVTLTSASGTATGEVSVTRNVTKGTIFAPNHFAVAGINNLFGAEVGGEMVFVKIEKAQ